MAEEEYYIEPELPDYEPEGEAEYYSELEEELRCARLLDDYLFN